jgi:hypothetical protein
MKVFTVINMLEEVEMRFILTDDEGKLLGCYSEYESAEIDAKDMVEGKEDINFYIYELLSAQKIGEPYLQNIYELRKSYPESDEPESEDEETTE